jgi:hypothetical protein
MATTYTAASIVYDRSYSPKVTLTRDTTGRLTATIELTGLDPDRDVNADERKRGITSLDPPTVESRPLASRPKTLRVLIDGSWRAVAEAIAATPGLPTMTPADLASVCLRVTGAVRAALREMDEDT